MKHLHKIFPFTFFLAFLLAFFVIPAGLMYAQESGLLTGICANPPDCGVEELFRLANRIIDICIIISIPLATVAFAYAGFVLLTAQGSTSKMSKAKKIFTNVLIGFGFVLGAWLIVETITSAVLKDGTYYNPLSVATLERRW